MQLHVQGWRYHAVCVCCKTKLRPDRCGCCAGVWGSTLLLRGQRQLTWTLLSELSKWALVISRSLIRQSPGQEQRPMSHWTTEHWISINSRIWQQGGVGSQTASASFVKNTHNYQNETINNTFIYFKMFVRSQSESFNKFRKFGAKLAQEFSKFSMTTF